jgi:cytochrome c oxidase subunit II
MKLIYFFFLFLLSSCSSNIFQSAWSPGGPEADRIKTLSWILFSIGFVIFVFVSILLAWALLKSKKSFTEEKGERFILLSGLIIPSIILVIMLVYSLRTTVKVRSEMTGAPFKVSITGHQWWWEVRYPDYNIVSANELYLPAGRPILVELTSKDVIHSFWVPNVHGKMDMIPGVKTTLTFSFSIPGEYRGVCAEFCGYQHALMAFPVMVLSDDSFNDWLKKNSTFQRVKLSPIEEKGQDVFFKSACHSCHRIEGTLAEGVAGPDLTLFASRKSLAAGTIPNNRKNLSQWIRDPGSIKPLNRMPPTPIDQNDLEALLTYLETLK